MRSLFCWTIQKHYFTTFGQALAVAISEEINDGLDDVYMRTTGSTAQIFVSPLLYSRLPQSNATYNMLPSTSPKPE